MVCYFLAKYPSVQNKLHKEVMDQIELLIKENEETDPIKLVTFDSLSKFEYLNAVINEVLRLSPPLTNIERIASRDIRLETFDGKTAINVQQGDIIYMPIYSIHRDPVQFPEPEQFKPERFIGRPTFHNYAYLPFGSGPRNCVAKSLAMMECKMAIVHIVRCFQLKFTEQTKDPVEYFCQSVPLSPKNVWLSVEQR